MKKKLVAGLLTGAMMAALLTGCAGSGSDKSSDAKESYTIGIEQFAEHGSLDNCREGFLQGLEEEGIKEGDNLKVEMKNAAADMGTAGQISDSFVSDKVDLICAIATPSAQSAYNAAMDAGIPVIYTAVTDPVAAELASEDGTPAGEVTGTSDKLPVEEQLKMIREMLPQAKTIGIMYTTSEVNSASTLAEYKEKAADYGFEIVESGVSSTADIPLAADSLLEQVDCLNNLTDNTVVASLPLILSKANAKNIPVFGSEIEQVKIGCLAAMGLDYVDLGKQTGRMAAEVLKGEKKASELNFEVIETAAFYGNSKVAEDLGITYLKDKICSEMSGGELQMVLIARALTIHPNMLVLDEPESNLDFKNQLIILETIEKLAREKNISAIVNTHYPDHALKISNKALILNRDGTNFYGNAAEVINEPNMEKSFSVRVHIDNFTLDEREYNCVVPLNLL